MAALAELAGAAGMAASSIGFCAQDAADARGDGSEDDWDGPNITLGPVDMPIADGRSVPRKRGRKPQPVEWETYGRKWAELDPENRNEAAWRALSPGEQHTIVRQKDYKRRKYTKRGDGSGTAEPARTRGGRTKQYTWKTVGHLWARLDPASNTESEWNAMSTGDRQRIAEEAEWKTLPRRRRKTVVPTNYTGDHQEFLAMSAHQQQLATAEADQLATQEAVACMTERGATQENRGRDRGRPRGSATTRHFSGHYRHNTSVPSLQYSSEAEELFYRVAKYNEVGAVSSRGNHSGVNGEAWTQLMILQMTYARPPDAVYLDRNDPDRAGPRGVLTRAANALGDAVFTTNMLVSDPDMLRRCVGRGFMGQFRQEGATFVPRTETPGEGGRAHGSVMNTADDVRRVFALHRPRAQTPAANPQTFLEVLAADADES